VTKDREDFEKNRTQRAKDEYLDSLKKQGIDVSKIDMDKLVFAAEDEEMPEVVG
jgi:hypothetical protein